MPKVVRNCLISPLRHIPGPFLARITSKWLVFVDLAGNRTSTIHRLHGKYGPSVRIGPNEVSFANGEMVKELYGQRTSFMKAPVYDTFSFPPVGVFSLRDRDAHSQRRRLLSGAFSQSNLNEAEPLLQTQVKRLVTIMEESCGKAVDVLALFRMFALDVVGRLLLPRTILKPRGD